MIAFIEEKNDKKQLVVAKIVGDMNQIFDRIDSKVKYNDNDKAWVKHYLFQGMIPDTYAQFGDRMFCNVRDIIKRDDIDNNLKNIYIQFDSSSFEEYLFMFAPRLLIFYSEVLPFIKIKEIGKCDYNFIKGSLRSSNIYKSSNDKYESFIESARINTMLFEMMRKRLRKNNYDEENVENILNSDIDDTTIVSIQHNNGDDSIVYLKRKNAKTGADILID